MGHSKGINFETLEVAAFQMATQKVYNKYSYPSQFHWIMSIKQTSEEFHTFDFYHKESNIHA